MTIYEIEDICEILKIGKSTAYELVRNQEIQAFKIHGVWKVHQSSLEEFIRNSILKHEKQRYNE